MHLRQTARQWFWINTAPHSRQYCAIKQMMTSTSDYLLLTCFKSYYFGFVVIRSATAPPMFIRKIRRMGWKSEADKSDFNLLPITLNNNVHFHNVNFLISLFWGEIILRELSVVHTELLVCTVAHKTRSNQLSSDLLLEIFHVLKYLLIPVLMSACENPCFVGVWFYRWQWWLCLWDQS